MEASPTYEPVAQHPMATRLLTAQPDAVLCRLAARGNIGAYDALYQRYRQPIFAFVFHLIGRADATEDAEDIAQDAFTRAFASIREKSFDGSFKAWLYTIARNRTYDVMRARKQKVVSLDAEIAEPPVAPAADGPAERAEQRAEFAWLMAAVSDLPERQRDALLLREMAGLSHDQIADELGTSVSATKKLISRGRDGIGEAALAGGYGRVARRKLGHDLALAAPLVPLTATLGAMGIGAGAGTVAAGGAAIAGGKVAATALTVLAIGGGAVAVEHKAKSSPPPQPVADQQNLLPGGAATVGAKAPAGAVRRPVDGDRRGRDGSGSSGNGREVEPGDDRGGHSGDEIPERSGSGGQGRSRGGGADDVAEAGDDRRGGSGNSGRGGGSEDSGQQSPATEPGDDGGGSNSGSGSGSGSDSSGKGKSGGSADSVPEPGED